MNVKSINKNGIQLINTINVIRRVNSSPNHFQLRQGITIYAMELDGLKNRIHYFWVCTVEFVEKQNLCIFNIRRLNET